MTIAKAIKGHNDCTNALHLLEHYEDVEVLSIRTDAQENTVHAWAEDGLAALTKVANDNGLKLETTNWGDRYNIAWFRVGTCKVFTLLEKE